MNKTFLESRIREHFNSKTEFAKSLGIQLGSLTDWFARGVIPNSRIDEVFSKLKIESEEEIESALNLPKLEVCYRAKKKDLLEKDVPIEVQSNIKRFSKVYLGLKGDEKVSSDVSEIRIRIGDNRNVVEVASIIRDFLDLTERNPFNINSINYILEKYGINVFFIPFDSFKFCIEGAINPLAFTAQKNNQYLVLCDSNRTFDEIYFDLTHELIHIFTGLVNSKTSQELEDFIDAVAEELVYPKKFLQREFPFLAQVEKGRITPQNFLDNNLRKMVQTSSFMSPRGISKRLLSLGLLNDRQAAYHWLYETEHNFYLKHFGTPLTVTGRMDIDFSDAEAVMSFMNDYVMKDQAKYPLFIEFYNGLVQGRITVRAFGEVFGIDSGEADEMRLIWQNKENCLENASCDEK
ncbi:MAG TPA: hypothetical protein VNJ08_12150 [Bacteriovoracaceae bacterium]|nr:hypothetical protein [Bacteriovoracaceae bacterium]